jgi:spore coat protein JC
MFEYEKRLAYPIKITKPDLEMAKVIISQYGGPQGELAAALRYLNQAHTAKDPRMKALLVDIATEEFSHIEMIAEMLTQLTKGLTIDDYKKANMAPYYTEHGFDLYYESSTNLPFRAEYISAVGDELANLSEDMAAEQKARAVYEHLIDQAKTDEVRMPLLFLRQREVVHFNRFKEMFDILEREKKQK